MQDPHARIVDPRDPVQLVGLGAHLLDSGNGGRGLTGDPQRQGDDRDHDRGDDNDGDDSEKHADRPAGGCCCEGHYRSTPSKLD